MSQINYARYKYTPDEIEEKEFLARFVVRNDIFEDIFQDIQSSDYSKPTQHYIFVGQRGQGKTTLLRKIQIEVAKDKKLSKFLLPVKFAEEQYQIRSLCRLWEEVADYLQSIYGSIFGDILDEMEKSFDDDDYDLKCFSILENAVKAKSKKLLLLIDNIDELLGKLSDKEQRRLREILLTSSMFRIIGGSTKMIEQHHDYGKPFYQFFKIVKLTGFNKEGTLTFLRAIGKGVQKKQIEKVIKNNPQKIETLRQLTGGVPRTLVILFDILVRDEGSAFDDLLKILDDVTPLYKHRMDDLPPQLQDIVHTIAINWDGMLTKDIAKKTKLDGKAVSAQLKQLEKYELVESESVGKNKIYKIKERFFNIWYLMRFGRKKDRQRVEWLVRFLESWCSTDELEARAKKLAGSIKQGKVTPNHAFFMTEALGYLGIEMEHSLKSVTKEFLVNKKSPLANELSMSDEECDAKATEAIVNGDSDAALRLFKRIKKPSNSVISLVRDMEFLNNAYSLNVQQAESGDAKAMEAIAIVSFANQRNPVQTLKYARMAYQNSINKTSVVQVYTFALLWNDEFLESFEKFAEAMNFETDIDKDRFAGIYLYFLIAKEQYYQAKKFFEIPKYELKEKYKPIWYALMTLMKDEFPEEIKKMGSELQESVDDALRTIKQYKKWYSIDKAEV